ncbi:Response regulators consisting of a CheY-like receiver domain and a winged-helix DNA-binding domain [Desulfuromusa kysingii]|uniref:Response regulators consisting of a CheY-like receiver domain and a winged-helix DNA-binding domain n=1 Tax=Desulfuromusa kysingii TaxID=37625 RepID=A0A1H4C364_9BACT|nr:response regulator [Desulfuromusa kysingii]SEA54780.1 Response regulators consisting of a CheY-like receiver domain and a winged-helix DNA-binding domain [Desulfuromusa kysingii]
MMKKLLLADDSITIQKVVGIIFSTEEYQLEMTDNGDSAFRKALEESPDLVLADISMPGKDGFELCRAIKSEPKLANTSVLLLPGAFDHFDEVKAGEVCADGWLTKPFESQALLDKVSQLLEAEPVRMAGIAPAPVEDAKEQDNIEIQDQGDVNESILGLDAVEELGATAAGVAEESPDDIWDTVSFAEEDLQSPEAPIGSDTEEEVSFAADVMAPEVAAEASIEANEEVAFPATATDADIHEDPVVQQESSFIEEPHSEPAFGTDLGVQPEAVTDVVSEEPLEDFEAVDFSVYNEPEVDPQVAVAGGAEELSSSPAEEDSQQEDPLAVEAVRDNAGADAFASVETEAAPVDLAADDIVDQGFETAAVTDEPVAFTAEPKSEDPYLGEEFEPLELADDLADEDTGIIELQEEELDSALADEEEPFVAEVSSDNSSEEDILDLQEDEIVADEVVVSEVCVAEEVEPPIAEVPDVEQVAELEDAVEVVEEEGFYFDAAADDQSDVAVTADVVSAVAANNLAPEAEVSATEHIEQQLRELSEEELKAVVAQVAGPMIEKIASEMVEKIAWEVVPDLAEAMIKEEIRKIKAGE